MILQEFATNMDEIGIYDIGKKMFPPEKIINEISAFRSNMKIFQHLINFFISVKKAFRIMAKSSKRKAMNVKLFRMIADGCAKTRYIINEMKEYYIMNENRIILKEKKLIEQSNNPKYDFMNEEDKLEEEEEQEEDNKAFSHFLKQRRDIFRETTYSTDSVKSIVNTAQIKSKSDKLNAYLKKALDRILPKPVVYREHMNKEGLFN